jgi:uncharacterized phage-associated protein
MRSIKFPIRFKFELDKLIASISFFADNKLDDLSKLKVCKLLYFADKHHLVKYGRPILGDTYFHLDNGPVPSNSLNIMNEVIASDTVYLKSGEVSNEEKFEEYLFVRKPIFSKHPIFCSRKQHHFECLSESELEALRVTMEKYGKKSPSALIELTHEEAAWKKSASNSEIDYRLFFEDDVTADPRAKEYMEAMQENVEVMFGLE